MFILDIYTVTSVCNRPIAADYINQPIGKFLVIMKAIFFFLSNGFYKHCLSKGSENNLPLYFNF